MPDRNVAERLQELAAELNLDLDESEAPPEPLELIAWLKEQNEAKRVQEAEHRDDIDRELDKLEVEILEDDDDDN
jgi:hypothetical protein